MMSEYVERYMLHGKKDLNPKPAENFKKYKTKQNPNKSDIFQNPRYKLQTRLNVEMVNFRLYSKFIFNFLFSLGVKMTLQLSRKFTISTFSLVCNLYLRFFKMSLSFGFCFVLYFF